MDLLGLDSSPASNTATQPAVSQQPPPTSITAQKNENPITDTFDFFSDANSTSVPQTTPKNGNDSLKQEEDDFFNQKSLENGVEKGKLTKDNILALYGSSSVAPAFVGQPTFNANFQAQPPQESFFNNFGQPVYKTQIPPQQFIPSVGPVGQSTFPSNFPANGNYGNVNSFGTMQSQQINRLNEENIRKIESLNFNNFK